MVIDRGSDADIAVKRVGQLAEALRTAELRFEEVRDSADQRVRHVSETMLD